MTRLGDAHRMNCISITARDKRDFSFIRSVQTSSGAHSSCHFFFANGCRKSDKKKYISFTVSTNLSILMLNIYFNKVICFKQPWSSSGHLLWAVEIL